MDNSGSYVQPFGVPVVFRKPANMPAMMATLSFLVSLFSESTESPALAQLQTSHSKPDKVEGFSSLFKAAKTAVMGPVDRAIES